MLGASPSLGGAEEACLRVEASSLQNYSLWLLLGLGGPRRA